jgi:hypothetical protein
MRTDMRAAFKLLPALLTMLLFYFYIHYAPPTIIFGDGGELVTAASMLGISHPPGYPIYMLLAKSAIALFPGDQAFRVDILAVILAVMLFIFTARLANYLIRRLIPAIAGEYSRGLSLLTAVFYSLSPHFFLQAVHEKGGVYTCVQLLAVISLYYALRFADEKKPEQYYAVAYMAGFLPVLHQTGLILSLALLFLPAIASVRLKKGAVRKALIFYMFSFMTPYLYLFIRVKAHPAMCWAGITTGYQVVNHIFRMMYTDPEGYVPMNPVSALFKINSYLSHLWANFSVLPVFAAAGLAAVYQKSKRGMWALVVFLALNIGVVFIFTGNQAAPVYSMVNLNFYVMNDLVLMVLSGVGIAWISFKAHGVSKQTYAAICMMLAGIVIVLSVSAIANNDRSRYFAAYDRAENVMKTIPPGAIFFSSADTTAFNILYFKYIRNKYTDRTAYDLNANILDLSIYSGLRAKSMLKRAAADDAVIKICDNNPGRVFFSEFTVMNNGALITGPYGIVNLAAPVLSRFSGGAPMMAVLTIRDYFNIKKPDYFTREELGRYFARRMELAAMQKDAYLADIYGSLAERISADIPATYKSMAMTCFYILKDSSRAIRYLEKAGSMEPFFKPTMNLLVNIYLQTGDTSMAMKELNAMLPREFDPVEKEKITGRINSVQHSGRR